MWLLWLVFPIIAGIVADRKGRSGGWWFLLGLFIGPFALVVIALPSVEEQHKEQARRGNSNEFRKCPYCAEVVRSEAIKCRFCGSELPAAAPTRAPGQLGYTKGQRIARDLKSTRLRNADVWIWLAVIILSAWLATAVVLALQKPG